MVHFTTLVSKAVLRKRKQRCKKRDCSCQLVWKHNWENQKWGELGPEDEVWAHSHHAVSQFPEHKQHKPQPHRRRLRDHLIICQEQAPVLCFSIRWCILVPAVSPLRFQRGIHSPAWESWGTGAGVGRLLTQSFLLSCRETFLILKSGPPVASGFVFHLRDSLFQLHTCEHSLCVCTHVYVY